MKDVKGDKQYRMVLLNENVELTKDQSDFIASIGGEVELKYEVKLGYAHFSTSEILRYFARYSDRHTIAF